MILGVHDWQFLGRLVVCDAFHAIFKNMSKRLARLGGQAADHRFLIINWYG